MLEIESIKELPDCDLVLLLLSHSEVELLVKRKGMYLYKINEKSCYVFAELQAYSLMKQNNEIR